MGLSTVILIFPVQPVGPAIRGIRHDWPICPKMRSFLIYNRE
jgi:hypothetical protein